MGSIPRVLTRARRSNSRPRPSVRERSEPVETGASSTLPTTLSGLSLLEPEPAREAARIMAAFYIGSMPVELLARHGIEFDDVKPIVEAFTAGDVQRALELTSPELGAALSVAGTARDWIEKIERDFLPAGFNHLLVTFADPFLVESWSGPKDRRSPRALKNSSDSFTTK